jgi:hypothetical protein
MMFADDQVTRFWGRVQKTDTCWLYTGAMNEHGYGLVNVKGKIYKAHRFAYLLLAGPIPDGLFLCHQCDTPACVRPDHMFVGTQKDNLQDMSRKGRGSKVPNGASLQSGNAHWTHRKPESIARGERHRSRTAPESIMRGESHYYRQHPERVIRGEQHANAKLKDAQAKEIAERYKAGGITMKALAGEYAVSTSLVHLIVNGKRRA